MGLYADLKAKGINIGGPAQTGFRGGQPIQPNSQNQVSTLPSLRLRNIGGNGMPFGFNPLAMGRNIANFALGMNKNMTNMALNAFQLLDQFQGNIDGQRLNGQGGF